MQMARSEHHHTSPYYIREVELSPIKYERDIKLLTLRAFQCYIDGTQQMQIFLNNENDAPPKSMDLEHLNQKLACINQICHLLLFQAQEALR